MLSVVNFRCLFHMIPRGLDAVKGSRLNPKKLAGGSSYKNIFHASKQSNDPNLVFPCFTKRDFS